MRRFIFPFVAIALASIIALIAAELTLRAAFHETVITDPVLRIRHEPAVDGWDANGFRNPMVLTEAEIVAIGDSQTEGNNATREEAWPLVLGSLASTSVYSMALGGYGPVQYAELAKQAVSLKPKIMIVAFYTGNDLLEAEKVVYELPYWHELQNAAYTRPEEHVDQSSRNFRIILGSGITPGSFAYRLLEIRMWLRSEFRLYALLGNATRRIREIAGIVNSFEEKQEAVEGVAEKYPELAYIYDDPSLQTILSPAYRFDTVNLQNPQTQEGWRITQERFGVIKDIAAQANIQLVFLVIPTKEKVYLEYMRNSDKDIPESFIAYDQAETALVNEFDNFCATNNIYCVSSLPFLTNALEEGHQIYGNSMDGHPKADGYAAIARGLFAQLREADIVQ